MAKAASNNVEVFGHLSEAYQKLGSNIQAQKQFLIDNQKDFENLGISVDNVTDAENILIKNKDAFIESEIAKAAATAARKAASDEMVDAIKAQKELEDEAIKRGIKPEDAEAAAKKAIDNRSKQSLSQQGAFTAGSGIGGINTTVISDPDADLISAYSKLDRAKKTIQGFWDAADTYNTTSIDKFKQSGAKEAGKAIDGSIGALQKKIQDEQASLQKMAVSNVTGIQKANVQIQKDQAELDQLLGKSTSSKQADRQAKNLQKANEKLIQLQAEINTQYIKAEQDKQQAVIDAMNDGFAKKEAQQALDQEKELLRIKIYAQKQQKTLLEAGKETYIQNNKGSEKGWSVTDFNTMTQTGKPMTGFSADQAGQFQTDSAKITEVVSDMTANVTAKYAHMGGMINDEVDQMTTKEQQKFASSLSKQLADIDAYYNAQLDKAEGNAALMSELKTNWVLASNQATIGDSIKQDGYQKELDMQQVTDLQSIGMKELAARTKYEIDKKYEQLELNNLLKLGAAATDADKQRIAALRGLLAAPDPNAGALNNQIKAALEGIMAANPQLKQINAEAQKMGSYVSAGLADVKSGVGGMMNETEGQVVGMVGSIAKGFGSGGIIGGAMAVLSVGFKLIGGICSANARQAAALKVILEAQINLQRQYNLELLKMGLEAKQLTNVFGTDELSKALNDIKIYEKASLDAQTAIKGNAPKASAYTGLFGKGQASLKQEMDNYNKGFEGLASIHVVTGHAKTGLFGSGKGKDTFSSILDAYPKLIDANGKFDASLAKTIISTQKMGANDKAALQNMIDLTDEATQAQDALASSLSSIFGNLAEESSTAFMSMAQTGEDAFSHIEGSASDMLKNIAKQIIQSDFLQPIFDKAQTQIQDLYKAKADGTLSDADFEKQMAAIMGGVVDQEKGIAQQSQTIYDTMNQAAENAGIDMNAATTRTGTTAAGLASASQDSIGVLTGTMLALQSSAADVRNLATEDQLIFKTMQSSLDAIASNTAYCQHLEGMASIIQDIQLRGVIVRTNN